MQAQKKYAYEGELTLGMRILNRLSSKLTTKAAREQKRGPCAGSKNEATGKIGIGKAENDRKNL
jgi:hypothetical protein